MSTPRLLCSVKASAACHLACLDLQVPFSLPVKVVMLAVMMTASQILACARHCDWHDFVLRSQHPCEVDLITSIFLRMKIVLLVYQRRQDIGLDLCEFTH